MTTRVRIENADANAQRTVKVTVNYAPNPHGGPSTSPTEQWLAPGEGADFWVHSSNSIVVTEVEDTKDGAK
jgi:hypothetical protein